LNQFCDHFYDGEQFRLLIVNKIGKHQIIGSLSYQSGANVKEEERILIEPPHAGI
jgi:hypothetical protein